MKDLIKQNGYTILSLSRKTGISHQALYNLINGKSDFRKMELGNAFKLALALKINLNYFYSIWLTKCDDDLKKEMKKDMKIVDKNIKEMKKIVGENECE